MMPDQDLPISASPEQRPRRLRSHPGLRRMVRETELSRADFMLPLFAVEGSDVRKEVGSMPGVYQESVDRLAQSATEAQDLGLTSVILFGVPDEKDALGSSSWTKDGLVQRTLEAVAKEAPEILRVVDLCFCEYTDHGHCGVVTPEGEVDNDPTLDNLARQAVSLADAGAQVIAPSGMMDGMVGAIRDGLDDHGHSGIPILSYAVKYASAFYGPFRDVADSAPAFGDRRTYQMDPGNSIEALREAALDVAEGADMLMVKPAMPYLDILRMVKDASPVPVGAYQVSGEYAMLHAAARNGWLDLDRTIEESLLSIRRAGADFILTYAAREMARRLA
ncbi:MAG: porphobilinogen synthase [Planctomycetota bacterium]|jgi:porphobilinogen synthase